MVYWKAGTDHQAVFQGALPCCICNWFWHHINTAALLVGFIGMYWTNPHLPRNPSRALLSVKYSVRLYIQRKAATTLSKMSRIAAKRSVAPCGTVIKAHLTYPKFEAFGRLHRSQQVHSSSFECQRFSMSCRILARKGVSF